MKRLFLVITITFSIIGLWMYIEVNQGACYEVINTDGSKNDCSYEKILKDHLSLIF